MRRHYLIISIVCFIIGAYTLTLLSASGTPSTLVVRTDANNYLLVTSVTQTNPVTQGVFSSRTLRTDSSGSLQVVLTGTVTPTYPMSIPASTCAAPSLGESGAATTGIAFTATPSILMCIAGTAVETITGSLASWTIPGSFTTTITDTRNALGTTVTDGIIAQNTTAATVGTPVQYSPNLKMCGTAYNSSSALSENDCWSLVAIPVTNAGTTTVRLELYNYINGGAATQQMVIGSTGNLQLAAGASYLWNGRSRLTSPADGQLAMINNGATAGFGFNFGTDGILKLFDNDLSTGGALEFLEQTAPAAGAANTARIYAVDNGAGKTQVCALFNTGAAQCFATQP